MKIAMFCSPCIQALSDEEKANLPGGKPPRVIGDLLDGGIVHARCEAGHEKSYILNEPLFDLMFELAALALVDGYHREAVIGTATALERFYEFYLRVFMHRRQVPDDVVSECWDQMQKQSERQWGAFLAAYLTETGRNYARIPTDKHVQLRNAVVHKGFIPTREKATDYARWALGTMHAVLSELFLKADGTTPNDDFWEIWAWNAARQRDALKGQQAASLGRSTLVHFAAPGTWGKQRFEDELEVLRQSRSLFYAEEKP